MIKLLFLLFFCQFAWAAPQDLYTFASPQESERFTHLTKELRCLVCHNQSLADSDATLAKDLRHKVYTLIQAQQSDAEIREFLVRRYGDFILFSPPLRQSTWLLWGFPGLILAVILGGLELSRRSRLK